MKHYLLLPILGSAAVAAALALPAQTNPPPAAASAASTNETAFVEILADHLRSDVDKSTNHVIVTVLEGNVRITHPQVKVTCDWLMALQPESGGRFTNVVAETNVVIDATDENGKPIHAIGDKAVYTVHTLTNGGMSERVELTGNNAVVQMESLTNTAPRIILTRINGVTGIETFNPVINLTIPNRGTNAPAKPKPRPDAP